jgi:hypothetical protein
MQRGIKVRGERQEKSANKAFGAKVIDPSRITSASLSFSFAPLR